MAEIATRRAWFLVLIAMAAFGSAAAAEVPVGTISVTVWEAGRDEPLPCRAWVQAGGRRCFEPSDKSCIPYARDRSFSCNGRFTIDVPAGKAVVHVERGKEYRPIDREIVVEENGTAKLDIELLRWVNMASQGWYSSDMHVHFGADNLATLEQLALADDVNWLPAFTYWNDFHEDWPHWSQGPSVFADKTHLVTLANEEIERIGGEPFHSIGALFIFGLTKPVYVPRHDHQYPCDAMLARIAKKTTPHCVIDTDKPTWGENVVTMALGLFDSVQVCHNHYHRDNDLPMCCGMAGADIEEAQRAWGPDELFLRTNMIYYRWLNCGFKLAVSGGAAMGVMPVPLGYSRTYARLDGPLTEENYLRAIRAGRTFATSGPMLTMTADGRDVGTTFSVSSSPPTTLRFTTELRSIDPIESLELVQDGRAIRQVDLSGRPTGRAVLREVLKTKVTPVRSGWVAARAIYRAPTGRLRQAHTSPVYFTVDDKPTASRRDAEYMIRWIDRLGEVSNEPDRYQSQPDRAEVQQVFREARQVYERIARTAVKAWGD